MINEVKETGTSLVDFNWDNNEEFFEVKSEPTVLPEKKVKEVVDEDVENLDNKEEKETEQDNFFEQGEEVKTAFSGDSQWADLYKTLKSKGIISVETEDDIDEEKFLELQEEEIEARLDETIQAFMDELDEDAKAFLKFKKEGGNTKEFFKFYSETSKVPELDITNEKSQKKFLEYYYRTYEEMDEDEVDDKIQWLEETGKMSKYAEKYSDSLEEEGERYKEKLLANQKAAAKQQEDNRKQLITDLKKVIDNNTEIKDWALTPKDKKDLHPYMTKAAVKVGNNQFLTQFQNDLQNVFKDKEKMILLAKIISSDFDVKDIKAKAKTEVIKETKQRLNSSKSSNYGIKGSHNKGLVDYF